MIKGLREGRANVMYSSVPPLTNARANDYGIRRSSELIDNEAAESKSFLE